MTKLNRCAAATLLALGLTAPLVLADDHDNNNNRRYYDKNHKDYHQWNANEDKSYGIYLNENHIAVHTFQKARPAEQQNYWNWRHDHPDEQR
jgi:hypothetical protein